MSQQSSPPGFDAGSTAAPLHDKVMVGVFIALVLVIFLILMLCVYVNWFFERSSSRSYTLSPSIAFVSPAHINTGLDKAAIAQLPTFVYKATSPVHNLEAGKLVESAAQPSLECSVCLSEFQENEKGRMLPSCKHTFHTECIDMWLFSHCTCPLCRATVGPALAISPETASTDQHHHEGEEQIAMEASLSTPEGNSVVSNAVKYPCNVLFSGNQMQVVSLQEPSSSSLPLPRSLCMPGAQITIDIPPTEGSLLVSASGPLFAKCTTEQEACSSKPLKSPSFRASIKRMLSRQSSRHKSSSQEGYEEK